MGKARKNSAISDETWRRRCAELREFVETNDGNLPVRHSVNLDENSLAQWLCQIQQRYRAGNLRIEHLDELREVPGMEERIKYWERRSPATWESRCSELRDWVNIHGRLPVRRAPDPTESSLAAFVSDTHAKKYRTGTLSAGQVELLESIPRMRARMLQWAFTHKVFCATLRIDEADDMPKRPTARRGREAKENSKMPNVRHKIDSDVVTDRSSNRKRKQRLAEDNHRPGKTFSKSPTVVLCDGTQNMRRMAEEQHGPDRIKHPVSSSSSANSSSSPSSSAPSSSSSDDEENKCDMRDSQNDKCQAVAFVVRTILGKNSSSAATERAFHSMRKKIGCPMHGFGLLTENILGEARDYCQEYWSKVSAENVKFMMDKIMENSKTMEAVDEKFGRLWKAARKQNGTIQADKTGIKSKGMFFSWEDLEEAERCSRRAFGHYDGVAPCARSKATWPGAFVTNVCRVCGSRCVKMFLAGTKAEMEAQPPAKAMSDKVPSSDVDIEIGTSELSSLCVPQVPPEELSMPFTPPESPEPSDIQPSSPAAPSPRQSASKALRSCLAVRRVGRVSFNSSKRIKFASELVHITEVESWKHYDMWAIGASVSVCEWCQMQKPYKTGQLWSQEGGQASIFVCKECVEEHC